jgi:hypothetical protein
MFFVGRANDTGATQFLVAKSVGGIGYFMYLTSGDIPRGSVNDGTDAPTSFGTITVNAQTLFSGATRRSVSADTIQQFLNGSVGDAPANPDTTTTTLTNALSFVIGSRSDASSSFFGGEVHAVALFREALTDAEIGLASGILANPEALNPYLLHEDALWGWIQSYDGHWDGSDTELVGALNQLNDTDNKEYAEGRGTYLGVPPSD